MGKTYQRFIIEKADEVFETLGPDIKPTERNKAVLCDLLTQKLIDGKLSEGDEQIFESEEEINKFVHQCWINDNLDDLQERGLIGSYNDGDSFFLTETGKLYVEKIMEES